MGLLLQIQYLSRHLDWALSRPVKGAQWSQHSGSGMEHPSDYLPDGYYSQNRDAILLFLLGALLLAFLLSRLRLLGQQSIVLMSASASICKAKTSTG
jgi:hypothetical protein